MTKAFSLKGKVALITGATNGIGQAMAIGLVENDVDQVIFTHRPSTSAEPTIKLLKAANPDVKVTAITQDLGDVKLDDIDAKIFQPALKASHTGQIDILINNAGYTLRHDFIGFPQDIFDKIIHINLNVPIKLSQLAGEEMLRKKIKGKIIFTASLASHAAGLSGVPYAVSKGGIRSLIQALANEWSSKGINVNGITPGYIKTNMTKDIKAESEANYAHITSRIPANRWGEPEDFKGPVVFLSSDASDYIHGEIIVVDGGYLAH